MKLHQQKTVRRDGVPILVLHVSLSDVEPKVWRRLQVRGDGTLSVLHAAIQVAMGWTNSHLHQFFIGETTYSDPDFEIGVDWGRPAEDEHRCRLVDLLTLAKRRTFAYEYDFGDSWEHVVKIEGKIGEGAADSPYAICLDGQNACPPDDCGGASGYADFLQAIKDPAHEEHESMLEWIGGSFDPGRFDIEVVNRCLGKIRKEKMTIEELATVLMGRDRVPREVQARMKGARKRLRKG